MTSVVERGEWHVSGVDQRDGGGEGAVEGGLGDSWTGGGGVIGGVEVREGAVEGVELAGGGDEGESVYGMVC